MSAVSAAADVLPAPLPVGHGRASVLGLSRLLARPAAQGRASSVLPLIAFGSVTALLLIVAGGAQKFWTWNDSYGATYQLLAMVALTLLVVPLLGLGGAAARLSARRRDDRLATLRLLGASSGLVAAIAVVEATVVAAAGALVGAVAYLLLSPAIGLIPFRGEPLGVSSVLLPWWAVAGVVAGVVVLAVLSAVVGLRRVVIEPLGVRTRENPPRMGALRVVLAVLLFVVAIAAMNMLGGVGSLLAVFVVLITAIVGVLAAINMIGPWVVRLIAGMQVRRAVRPERLLAARGSLENPKAAWRQVSPVAMTSFAAVFAGTGAAMLGSYDTAGMPRDDLLLIGDVRTGLLVTVIGTFLMVACAAGVGQASEILDRRELYRGLGMLGVPLRVLDRARRRQLMLPLLIATLGAAALAGALVFPLVGMTLIVDPLSLLVIAGMLAGGVLLVALALTVTAPLLRQAASAEGGRRSD